MPLGRYLWYKAWHSSWPLSQFLYPDPSCAYLSDAFWRTGYTVVSTSILAYGPPELSKSAILLQGIGTLGSEVLVYSRIPHSAIRHLQLLGQVLKRPERQRERVTHWCLLHTIHCKDKMACELFLSSKSYTDPLTTFLTPSIQMLSKSLEPSFHMSQLRFLSKMTEHIKPGIVLRLKNETVSKKWFLPSASFESSYRNIHKGTKSQCSRVGATQHTNYWCFCPVHQKVEWAGWLMQTTSPKTLDYLGTNTHYDAESMNRCPLQNLQICWSSSQLMMLNT